MQLFLRSATNPVLFVELKYLLATGNFLSPTGESYNRLSDTDSDDDLLLPKSDVEEDLRALA